MELKSPEVIEFAKKMNLPFYQSENINKDIELQNKVTNLKPDLVLVFAFAQFLNSFWLNVAKLGCFNIHTSLLPKYRGAAPIQYAILNGDRLTGVSIQKMVKQMDAGDICYFKTIEIADSDTGGSLYTRLNYLAAIAGEEFIKLISENNLEFKPQDESLVSFAPTLKKEDGFLDFENSESNNLLNKIRAFDPWPGTYFFLTSKRIKVLECRVYPKTIKVGTIQNIMGSLVVGTKTESLQITKLQLEGKKPTTDKELLLGWRDDLILSQTKEAK
jgi:methionyl-tRNA formyltransferase